MNRTRVVVGIVAGFVAIIGVVLAIALTSDNTETKGCTKDCGAAPDFRVTDATTGAPITLGSPSLRGKVVIVNFWNDWCVPCEDELPDLKSFWADAKQNPKVTMLGVVHEQDDRNAITKYVAKERINWPIAFDPNEQMGFDYGVTGQPETFVISGSGQVLRHIVGPIDPNELGVIVGRALGLA